MSEIYSQHTESIARYHILKDHLVQCNEELGMTLLKMLHGASPGASGAKLLQARNQEYPVVIKVFPVDCPFTYIRGRQRKKNVVRNYGDSEIGTGLMLTNTFILTHRTQNIVTCYNYTICNYSYQTDFSICHKTPISKQLCYPIIDNTNHPLYSYHEQYFTPSINGEIETPYRDDVTRYFMVEKCEGDLQGFISENADSPTMLLDILNYVVLMVFHTLLLFDNVLGGYSHNDLGLRNVLYVMDSYSTCNTYNRYIFPTNIVDIPSNIIIPKIWDYAYVRYKDANKYKEYYEYIGNDVPDYNNIEMEFRENDVFIFLQDLDRYLRANNISNSIFTMLDLQYIRDAKTNTHAIDEYFRQNPIIDNSNKNHKIIHTFTINI